jgi:hypothetical protein
MKQVSLSESGFEALLNSTFFVQRSFMSNNISRRTLAVGGPAALTVFLPTTTMKY